MRLIYAEIHNELRKTIRKTIHMGCLTVTGIVTVTALLQMIQAASTRTFGRIVKTPVRYGLAESF